MQPRHILRRHRLSDLLEPVQWLLDVHAWGLQRMRHRCRVFDAAGSKHLQLFRNACPCGLCLPTVLSNLARLHLLLQHQCLQLLRYSQRVFSQRRSVLMSADQLC